jgi:hypothetical protein
MYHERHVACNSFLPLILSNIDRIAQTGTNRLEVLVKKLAKLDRYPIPRLRGAGLALAQFSHGDIVYSTMITVILPGP